MIKSIQCYYCFELIELELYQEDGKIQDFVVDCEVCCHPLEIKAVLNEFEDEFSVSVEAGLG